MAETYYTKNCSLINSFSSKMNTAIKNVIPSPGRFEENLRSCKKNTSCHIIIYNNKFNTCFSPSYKINKNTTCTFLIQCKKSYSPNENNVNICFTFAHNCPIFIFKKTYDDTNLFQIIFVSVILLCFGACLIRYTFCVEDKRESSKVHTVATHFSNI